MEYTGTKRLSNSSGYNRPKKTYQETLSNQDIKEKLKEYKKVADITKVSIGTHIRYFNVDPKTKQKTFRLGGTLNKTDPEGKYVILSNGSVSWSVQIPNTTFFQKMTDVEFKEELKKELKKEIITEIQPNNEDIEALQKEIKNLKVKNEHYKKENEALLNKITTIENEIKKTKNKKN